MPKLFGGPVPEAADSTASYPGPPDAPAVDRGAVQQLEEQLGRDGLGALVRRFLDGAPERLAKLQDAAAAGDAARLREEAHSMKGAARSFGAAEMGELSARLEQDATSGSTEQAEELVVALNASLDRTRAELAEQLEAPAARTHERRVPVPSPEGRIAELERRVASLEQSLVGLLARGG